MKLELGEAVAVQAVHEALVALGAVLIGETHGVAGSQELDVYTYAAAGAQIVVEVETYIGVTIIGPDAILEQVRALTSRG